MIMSNDIFVITEYMDGKFSDVSFEMVGKAKELASAWGGQAVAVVVGGEVNLAVGDGGQVDGGVAVLHHGSGNGGDRLCAAGSGATGGRKRRPCR